MRTDTIRPEGGGPGIDDTDEARLRKRAEQRVREQVDFSTHLVIYVLVNTLLVVIWLFTTPPIFWPIFPIVGWGIGVAAHAWQAFGPDRVTEDRIQREMNRMR
jgi:hypothetical protein